MPIMKQRILFSLLRAVINARVINVIDMIRKNQSHDFVFDWNRRAVDFTPINASSSLSWCAYIVS